MTSKNYENETFDNPSKDLISFEPTLHLNQMTVFDIGANKEFFNKGLINHEIRTEIPDKISKVINKKLQNKEISPNIVSIPGYVLKQLANENPELIGELKKSVKTGSIILSGQTFSGTSSSVLSENELISEINKHKDILKTTLNFEPTSIVLDQEPSEKIIQEFSDKNILVKNKLRITELQKKVIDEVKKIKPFINEIKDEQLLNEINLLTSNQILSKLDENNAEIEFSPYEHYSNVMNMLNDVVHRINNFKNSEFGIVNEVSISEEPSKLLI